MNYIVESSVFLLLWGLKIPMKMSFIALEMWLFGVRNVLEFFKEFVRIILIGTFAKSDLLEKRLSYFSEPGNSLSFWLLPKKNNVVL